MIPNQSGTSGQARPDRRTVEDSQMVSSMYMFAHGQSYSHQVMRITSIAQRVIVTL